MVSIIYVAACLFRRMQRTRLVNAAENTLHFWEYGGRKHALFSGYLKDGWVSKMSVGLTAVVMSTASTLTLLMPTCTKAGEAARRGDWWSNLFVVGNSFSEIFDCLLWVHSVAKRIVHCETCVCVRLSRRRRPHTCCSFL